MAGLSVVAERDGLARRATLALALWLGFWLLAFGLIAALLWIPFAQSHYGTAVDLSGIIAGCAAITLAYTLRPRTWFRKADESGPPPLKPEEAPQLFALVDRIGRKFGVIAPVEIHLVAGATAFISAKRSWTGRVRSLRVGLGLPLFAWLSEAELGSVIAHEFGHFVGGDLMLGPWVHRTRTSIGETIHALDESMFFLDLPFRSYGNWFLRLSSSVSRAQENCADKLAAQHFGKEAACSALKKIHLLNPLWSAYLAHDFGAAVNRGAKLPVVEGFHRFCLASPRRAAVQDEIEREEKRPPTPYDTHPSLEERIAALGGDASSRLPALEQCWHLVESEAAAEAMWYERLNVEQLRPVSWDDFGAEILKPLYEKKFSGTLMAPEKLPLTELPRMMQELDAWWEKLRPDGVSFFSDEAKRRYVLQIFEEWLIFSLCQRGYVPVLRPGQSMVMKRDGESVAPDEIMKAAAEKRISADDLGRY